MAKARSAGMRIILTLTNYQPAFGGMQQWVNWWGGSSISDFYTNPAIRWQQDVTSAHACSGSDTHPVLCSDVCGMRRARRAAFKAYVAKIVLRRNHITGELYKDDPTILAWDLVNEPYNPGDASGQILRVCFSPQLTPHAWHPGFQYYRLGSPSLHVSNAACLQAWAADLAAYVKQLDPNHLIMLGTIGMFGASTPSLLQENPYDLSMDTYSKGGIYQADPICQVRNVPRWSLHLLFSTKCSCTPPRTSKLCRSACMSTCKVTGIE